MKRRSGTYIAYGLVYCYSCMGFHHQYRTYRERKKYLDTIIWRCLYCKEPNSEGKKIISCFARMPLQY